MFADLVPVLETTNVLNKNWFPGFIANIVDEVFQLQENDDYWVDNEISIWFIVDELKAIGVKSNRAISRFSIDKIMEEGRPKRIGGAFALPMYSNLTDSARISVSHLLAFTQNKKQAKEITDDFELDASYEKDMHQLKKFEVIAMTRDSFVTYDSEGNREHERGPIKGTVLPPLNLHPPPKKMEDLEEI